jgi:hypothetical protein
VGYYIKVEPNVKIYVEDLNPDGVSKLVLISAAAPSLIKRKNFLMDWIEKKLLKSLKAHIMIGLKC